WKPYAETIVKSADPTPTSRCVRRPASRSRSSRSIPTAPPSTAARNSRSRASSHGSDGIAALSKRSLEHGVLQIRDAHDARCGELEQLVEPFARERVALRRRLHLDQPRIAGHDDVHVRLRGRVLRVVEVEHRLAGDDT